MKPDRVVVAYSDGRPPLLARDLIRDNPETMCREYLGLDGEVSISLGANEICRKGSEREPWGTYGAKERGTYAATQHKSVGKAEGVQRGSAGWMTT